MPSCPSRTKSESVPSAARRTILRRCTLETKKAFDAGVVGDAFGQEVLLRQTERDRASADGSPELGELAPDAGELRPVAQRREVLVRRGPEVEPAVDQALEDLRRVGGVAVARLRARERVQDPGLSGPERRRLPRVLEKRRPVLGLVRGERLLLELETAGPGVGVRLVGGGQDEREHRGGERRARADETNPQASPPASPCLRRNALRVARPPRESALPSGRFQGRAGRRRRGRERTARGRNGQGPPGRSESCRLSEA